ncbi:F-box/kelch-repeat protein At3g06240-like isoform X2 [Rhododendron vialii]|uniref:F-box/kelch-repeat protein At3g06240-like isoform X2 n=1 Tax=Rhododendron vialii TaxID=182163 RepID=UPI00265FA6DD|nr:F-box/kelch-repeat protein At3g06240-like isoform X2 [Rhododendron vialii]
MSDYLHQDVLIDILTRLPAESLVRLTPVCKSWHSLITSPKFISHHLHRTASNPDNDRLLVRYRTDKPKQDHYSLVLDGFGFDPVSNDFKVVRVVHTDDRISPDVEIYTLKTGRWRYISEKALPLMIEERFRQAYVNGAAHWMAFHQGTLLTCFRYTILSFNMSDEVFNEILVPDSITLEGGLVVFKESLCLFQQCVNDNDDHYLVWIMKEYGVSTSWAKLFRIDLCGGLWRPLGLRKNGEVIFSTRDEDLVSCNYRSKQISYLGIHGTSGDGYLNWHAFYIDTYVESLVLLNKLESPENTVVSSQNKKNKKEEEEQKEAGGEKEEI